MRPPGLMLAFTCVLGSWAVLASAATGSASFNVNITLNKPGATAASSSGVAAGIRSSGGWSPACVSETQSEQVSALVRVVCAAQEFVNITPLTGDLFPGSYGGASRYYFAPGFVQRAAIAPGGEGAPPLGAGNVTILRIYNAKAFDGPLQMLVSF